MEGLKAGDFSSIARAISIVENELTGTEDILSMLSHQNNTVVIGITGPPGAGKSTLINSLAKQLSGNGKVAILAIDPTSPFNQGSLLGDRLRMADHFNNKNIYIRSLATRGSLGGLSARTIEITDVLKIAGFDFILIETVGVGQSEVEIVSLADTTIVVFVPESGDEIQTIKSGIMEIADIFVINKADRKGADEFANSIQNTLHTRPYKGWKIPVIKTVAISNEGTEELVKQLLLHQHVDKTEMREHLLFQKVLHLILNYQMRKLDTDKLKEKLKAESKLTDFNIYRFIKKNYQ